MPIPTIESVAKASVKHQESQVNLNSLAVSKLLAKIDRIAIGFASEQDRANFNPKWNDYLAIPQPDEEKVKEIEDAIIPDSETIRIFWQELKAGKIPLNVQSHLSPLFPLWEKIVPRT